MVVKCYDHQLMSDVIDGGGSGGDRRLAAVAIDVRMVVTALLFVLPPSRDLWPPPPRV